MDIGRAIGALGIPLGVAVVSLGILDSHHDGRQSVRSQSTSAGFGVMLSLLAFPGCVGAICTGVRSWPHIIW